MNPTPVDCDKENEATVEDILNSDITDGDKLKRLDSRKMIANGY